ncbi:unnamed protein product, partial [Mesorhabditis spiculigera]
MKISVPFLIDLLLRIGGRAYLFLAVALPFLFIRAFQEEFVTLVFGKQFSRRVFSDKSSVISVREAKTQESTA